MGIIGTPELILIFVALVVVALVFSIIKGLINALLELIKPKPTLQPVRVPAAKQRIGKN